jgi:hypothetical protein
MTEVPDADLTPLATAIARVAEAIATVAEDAVRKVARDTDPAVLGQQVEESLRKMVPSLVEAAVARERTLIEETAREVASKTLPDLLRRMVQQLAEEIIERVARDVVGEKAEAEVKKEIERLTADA